MWSLWSWNSKCAHAESTLIWAAGTSNWDIFISLSYCQSTVSSLVWNDEDLSRCYYCETSWNVYVHHFVRKPPICFCCLAELSCAIFGFLDTNTVSGRFPLRSFLVYKHYWNSTSLIWKWLGVKYQFTYLIWKQQQQQKWFFSKLYFLKRKRKRSHVLFLGHIGALMTSNISRCQSSFTRTSLIWKHTPVVLLKTILK